MNIIQKRISVNNEWCSYSAGKRISTRALAGGSLLIWPLVEGGQTSAIGAANSPEGGEKMQIEAAVARKEFAPLNFETLDLEAPRHDEVQVRLVASGVCHTDMAIRDQAIVPMPQPIVLGHEGAGVVEKVGASVTKVNVGDRVILSGDSCGNCPSCRVSLPSYCYEFFQRNFGGGRVDGTSPLSRKGENSPHLYGSRIIRHACRLPRSQRDQSE